MARKKIDSRIKTLVENSVKTRHRTFFVIVGDNAREQVVNLHYMVSKARVVSRPSVLWCYKKDLGFASDDRARAKRLHTIAKKNKQQAVDEEMNDPFHLWLAATTIRFCYFKESHTVLGNTYGMLVLQDFEAMTPNVLARTIETVEGSGIVVLLLPTMNSLKQLYTMAMDVHSRFRTDDNQVISARFNERFLLSLASCKNCLVVDDQLNVLPLSAQIKDIKPIVVDSVEMEDTHIVSKNEKELLKLKDSLKDSIPLGPLLRQARTLDQAKALLQFVEAISEKTLQSTVALTAARGRGKSSSLGLAIASAVAYGYSNIFVTAPSPENLKTLFEFILKGFDVLGMKDQQDYEIVQSSNPNFNKAIIRLNVFKDHRQTIQYIQPHDYQKLSQAELVVIDEAAAIPLPIVKKLLGPYLTFISSTVNGYEGTGRSLSLKLLQQLREKSQGIGSGSSSQMGKASVNRKFHEILLEEPIRYQDGDPIERWLYDLLLLDATSAPSLTSKCAHPSQCNLYYVNRDALFSYHEATEKFLKNMMSLFVSSHYKNSPNDLQLLADAPQHHIFVLLGPIDENTTSLPDVYCVIQVCMEGSINRQIVMDHLSKGISPSGDLIPYLISRQFQEPEFGSLSGARVVRVAVHPDYQRMGYGARALDLLTQYYNGELFDVTEAGEEDNDDAEEDNAAGEQQGPKEAAINKDEFEGEVKNINKEIIRPRDRKQLPPLLQTLGERKPEPIQYLGTSYGLTLELFNYWKKNTFLPVYLRLTQNELTGEHTCVMLKALKNSSTTTRTWLTSFHEDFKKRLVSLFSYDFKTFAPNLCLSIMDYKQEEESAVVSRSLSIAELDTFFINYDLKRLEAYSKNMLDFHVILDLTPIIAQLFFLKKLPFTVSYVQAAILSGLGLQHKQIEDIQSDLNIESNQVLALFNKIIKKVVKYLKEVDKLRFTKGGAAASSSKQAAAAITSAAKKSATASKGNVSVEEVMGDDNTKADDDDDEAAAQEGTKKKSGNADDEDMNAVFDEVFEKSSTPSKSKAQAKKREKKDSEMEPEERTAKKLKEKKEQSATTPTAITVDKKKSKEFAKKLLENPGDFTISNDITANATADDSGNSNIDVEKNDGMVQLQVDAKAKKLKSHMFKSKKELEMIEAEEKAKLVKKGGKKKRKIKA